MYNKLLYNFNAIRNEAILKYYEMMMRLTETP